MSVWAGLIERLEGLAEPDREIDAEIAAALEVVPEFDRSMIRQDVTLRFVPNDGGVGRVRIYCDASKLALHGRAVPPYTSSLDAALTLFGGDIAGIEAIRADLGRVGTPTRQRLILNLCIAALKARVSHGVDEPG